MHDVGFIFNVIGTRVNKQHFWVLSGCRLLTDTLNAFDEFLNKLESIGSNAF